VSGRSAPRKVFLYTPDEMWQRIDDVHRNPEKQRLPPRHQPSVTPYNNWPYYKQNATERKPPPGKCLRLRPPLPEHALKIFPKIFPNTT